ncbi:hypothetical protein AGMMS49992_12860 [Clostridia bacterium]|nr:hypothetical protein AGMMS49992_12860 [Clostridia bacterium]
MRIRWYDRVLIALSGLILLALGLLLIMTGLHAPKPVYDFGIKLAQAFMGLSVVHAIREGVWFALAALLVGGLLLALWGIRQWISLIPKRQKEQFFAATQIDRGTLTIARPALEHLVQKCVAEHPEMTVSKTTITSDADKATIRLRATMRSGVSMPKVTAALQKEIIAYLSECAGIAVSSVQVIVDDTTPPLMLPESVPIVTTQKALPGSASAPEKPQEIRENHYEIKTERTPEPELPREPESKPEIISEPDLEPDAIPIPLGSIVDDQPAVPVLASIAFPDEDVLDPMFSMNSRIDYNSINKENSDGEPVDIGNAVVDAEVIEAAELAEGGDVNAVGS